MAMPNNVYENLLDPENCISFIVFSKIHRLRSDQLEMASLLGAVGECSCVENEATRYKQM
jgi:hypothetical protein